MSTTVFKIDGNESTFSVEGAPEFKFGKNELLSKQETDISYHQPWYNEGYFETDFLSAEEFTSLQNGLIGSIAKIIKQETSINVENFTLSNYHHFIKTDADHLKVVTKTSDLFSDDFNFPVTTLMPRLGKILNFDLTDINPKNGRQMHIIVRINRPNSKDYNPPHKDIYQGVDIDAYIPQFINFWIPVAGVTEKSSLPLAPKSHLLSEDKILRTFEGGQIEGNKYRVRMVKSWDDDNSLIRSKVNYGQVLIFSSHLVHGLAVNDEVDQTRVALEFRLFKATN